MFNVVCSVCFLRWCGTTLGTVTCTLKGTHCKAKLITFLCLLFFCFSPPLLHSSQKNNSKSQVSWSCTFLQCTCTCGTIVKSMNTFVLWWICSIVFKWKIFCSAIVNYLKFMNQLDIESNGLQFMELTVSLRRTTVRKRAGERGGGKQVSVWRIV